MVAAGLQPAGYLALRTPLLPFDEFVAWGAGLRASAAASADLSCALAADRRLLTERLYALWERPEVAEAIALASPNLDVVLARAKWSAGESEHAKALRALATYIARMISRPAPFGLFAGISVGTISRETHLGLPERKRYRRQTRLDLSYLNSLAEGIAALPAVREEVLFEPNSSLYPAGGRYHYFKASTGVTAESSLVAVNASPHLQVALECARGGTRLATIEAALIDQHVDPEAAHAFVDELVREKVLTCCLAARVTGQADGGGGLADQLAKHASTREMGHVLERACRDLARIDSAGIGNRPEVYAEIRTRLTELPVDRSSAGPFQVDLFKPAPAITLGSGPTAEILAALDISHRIGRPVVHPELTAFRDRFESRYGQAEVILMEALDDQVGVGFGGARGLQLSSQPSGVWSKRDDFLLGKLTSALDARLEEITLQASDLKELESFATPTRMPDAVEVFVTLAATSEEAVNRGDFRVLFRGASGPPGVRCVARFGDIDPGLRRHVGASVRAEEALRPDAVFAEIVHVPDARTAAIHRRPVLRGLEIRFLSHSGAPADQQLPITDLCVSVRQGELILRSMRLDKEVIPRLSSAHNYYLEGPPVYRFLGALQAQATAVALGWEWGNLEHAAFLPRISVGRLVLSPASWNVTGQELRSLLSGGFAGLQAWRAFRRLPRFVLHTDGDQELIVDLDNVLSVEGVLRLLQGRSTARLSELFPPAEQMCVRGPEGRFIHDLIVPFVRRSAPLPRPPAPRARPWRLQRRYAPGSEWLYAKLYCGDALADGVLTDLVTPLVTEALDTGTVESWFFVRYADPEPHVRLRLRGEPARLGGQVLPELERRAAPLLRDGRLFRLQLDTYLPEEDRYGGADGLALAERLFCFDSQAALEIVALLKGDRGRDLRWKLALCGVDLYFDVLGLDLQRRLEWMTRRRDALATQLGPDAPSRNWLGAQYRRDRQSLRNLFVQVRSPTANGPVGADILRRLRDQLEPLVSDLRRLDCQAGLTQPLFELAASFVHMHLNRMLRVQGTAHELGAYDTLARMYLAEQARQNCPTREERDR